MNPKKPCLLRNSGLLILLVILPMTQSFQECVWNNWSDWQQCSKSCGYGYQSRTRPRAYVEEDGERKRCDGKTKERRGCNKQNCDGSVPLSDGFIVSVNRCTASVIGDNWLLTAAHCFENEIHRNHVGSIKTESDYGDAILDLSKSQSRPYKAMKRKSLPVKYKWTRPMEYPQKGSRFIKEETYWRKVDKIIIHHKFINEARSWKGFDFALIKLSPEHG